MKDVTAVLLAGLAKLDLSAEEKARILALPPCPKCAALVCDHPENQTTTAQMRSLLYAVLEAAGASPESMGILPETPERRTQ